MLNEWSDRERDTTEPYFGSRASMLAAGLLLAAIAVLVAIVVLLS